MTQPELPGLWEIPHHKCSPGSGNRALDRLWDVVVPTRPVASTSLEAHARITKSGKKKAQMETVADLVRQYPGKTSRDLALLCATLTEYQIARRLSDLKDASRVRQGEKTTSENGFPGVTWWLV